MNECATGFRHKTETGDVLALEIEVLTQIDVDHTSARIHAIRGKPDSVIDKRKIGVQQVLCAELHRDTAHEPGRRLRTVPKLKIPGRIRGAQGPRIEVAFEEYGKRLDDSVP